jgi:hypothetical protein
MRRFYQATPSSHWACLFDIPPLHHQRSKPKSKQENLLQALDRDDRGKLMKMAVEIKNYRAKMAETSFE